MLVSVGWGTSQPFSTLWKYIMGTRHLATVTSDLIACYGNTARNIVNAYRAGNERVVGFMDQRWERALVKSGQQLSAEVRGNALSAQKKLSSLFVKGVAITAGGADTAIDTVVGLADKSVRRVAANASRFEQRTGVTALNKLAVAVVPAAEAVGKMATRLESQSRRLAGRLAGATSPAARRVTPLQRARARARARTAA